MTQTAFMKIGLYSITYLGCWYRGEALTLPELIRTAKDFGYDGVEIDGDFQARGRGYRRLDEVTRWGR